MLGIIGGSTCTKPCAKCTNTRTHTNTPRDMNKDTYIFAHINRLVEIPSLQFPYSNYLIVAQDKWPRKMSQLEVVSSCGSYITLRALKEYTHLWCFKIHQYIYISEFPRKRNIYTKWYIWNKSAIFISFIFLIYLNTYYSFKNPFFLWHYYTPGPESI